MLVFRIISTVIMGMICLIAFVLSLVVVSGKHELAKTVLYTLACWTVLAFVIVTLWII